MVSPTKRYGIIVGIDGSPESDAAVNWAAHDAAIRGLPLTVVHVESPAAATWSQAPVLEESPAEQQAEGHSLLAHASTIAHAAIAETAQVQITGELLSSATPVPTARAAICRRGRNARRCGIRACGRCWARFG